MKMRPSAESVNVLRSAKVCPPMSWRVEHQRGRVGVEAAAGDERAALVVEVVERALHGGVLHGPRVGGSDIGREDRRGEQVVLGGAAEREFRVAKIEEAPPRALRIAIFRGDEVAPEKVGRVIGGEHVLESDEIERVHEHAAAFGVEAGAAEEVEENLSVTERLRHRGQPLGFVGAKVRVAEEVVAASRDRNQMRGEEIVFALALERCAVA